ncbi:hypothetical protein ACR9YC_07075 [Parasphingorhabdus sp. DH2-15]|uniref:hypothetical protein n=1 Tax=Parasphingorhabdus sp. DH2-15 TaxID=3444112 RepID=UPI003F68681E
MITFPHMATSVALAALLALVPQSAFAQGRPYYSKGVLKGYLVGKCSKKVDFKIIGPERRFFTSQNPDVRPLVIGLTQLMRQECPRMERVRIQGYVGEDVVYSAVAEKAGQWTFFVVPPGKEYARRGAGIGLANKLGNLRQRNTLMPAAELSRRAQRGERLCVDPQNGTCTYELSFQNFGASGGIITTRYDVNGSAQALTSSRSTVRGGDAFCSDPAKASIEVRGGNLSQAGRGELAGSLAEQSRSLSAPVCNVIMTRGNRFVIAGIDGTGAELGEVTAAAFISRPAVLRRRD